MRYHSAEEQHCDEKKINHVYSETPENGQCYKFHLPLLADVEIFASRSDNGASFEMFYACQAKIHPISRN